MRRSRAWARVVAAFGGRCAYCLATTCALTRDHYVPIAKGGRPVRDGWAILGHLVPACRSCNQRKAATLPGDLDWLTPQRRAYIEFVLQALRAERARYFANLRRHNVR